ncbi:hypothetical protein B1748_00185 [Paenibacillus sp. MY03]|jgi:putative aldouronate transport system substrate-binding protein|uniref:ABC transporter substrate-binding protein n=1 Tax=Paenibacillus agaridevorans TaxID=171404 RepID=A0A2R5EGG0_9BACL|nr:MULTISPECIES: extracellular solute-binding protein [Paenibacillus]OUS78533.1 hypothetical protein B1748_00185 [Paenibacillus sp. MY03]GBG05652.1 hypothetical protein PAT3040_00136 [Paenibacillus agaridevorans]
MMQWKKTGAVLATVIMLLSILAACSSNKETPKPSNEGVKPTGEQTDNKGNEPNKPKGKISISVFDRGWVAADEGTYESNRWTKWINENSPTEVEIIPVPRNEAQSKLNALIASGEAPDLIWEYDRNYMTQLAAQGAIQPIGEYIEKYSTSYKAYLEKNADLLPYLTVDNKVYAIASKRGVDAIANHAMWVRQDILDRLQLKAPTTVEELFEVARKIKEDDPTMTPIAFNGNGNPIMRTLFQAVSDQWYLEEGKLVNGRTLDRHRDSLAFQKQLFDEGLIDKEYITDNNFERANQLWVTGKAAIMFGAWDMPNQFRDLMANVPDAKMVPLEPFATQYGKTGLYQETPANIYVMFNSEMSEEKIKDAIAYLDWMIEDNWLPLKKGNENEHYKLVDGVPQTLDSEQFRKEVLYAFEYAVVHQWSPEASWFPILAAQDDVAQAYAKQQSVSIETALKNNFRRDIAYNPDLPELSQLIATFKPIAEQIETKVVTGGSAMTPQQGIDEIRKEWKRLGGENIESMVQEWYEANKGNL